VLQCGNSSEDCCVFLLGCYRKVAIALSIVSVKNESRKRERIEGMNELLS